MWTRMNEEHREKILEFTFFVQISKHVLSIAQFFSQQKHQFMDENFIHGWIDKIENKHC